MYSGLNAGKPPAPKQRVRFLLGPVESSKEKELTLTANRVPTLINHPLGNAHSGKGLGISSLESPCPKSVCPSQTPPVPDQCRTTVAVKCLTRDWQNFLERAAAAAAAAKLLQSCLTLCDPIDGSPPGSPVPGILQATTLEWIAISFSNA